MWDFRESTYFWPYNVYVVCLFVCMYVTVLSTCCTLYFDQVQREMKKGSGILCRDLSLPLIEIRFSPKPGSFEILLPLPFL